MISAYLAASLAHVWFLSGMDSHMHSQGRSLNELFATARKVASVGSDTTVNAF